MIPPSPWPAEMVAALLGQERQALVGRLLKGLVHNISGGLQLMRLPLDMLEIKAAQGQLQSDDVISKLGILQQGLAKVSAEVETLSARSAQQTDVEPRALHLPSLVGEQLAFWRADMFFKHEAELTQDFSPARTRVRAAYADVALAFNALLANALESLQAAGRRALKVAYRETPGWVHLEVCDEGPGPAPDLAERVFEAFVGDKGPEHPGLGLFLAAQALAPWQGRLDWEARPQTCFLLSLPESGS
jgi:signal transduction histidine kinase